MSKDYPQTPDGRYFVAKGRLWRKTDPRLDDGSRRAAVKRLMQARRAVGQAATPATASTPPSAASESAARSGGTTAPRTKVAGTRRIPPTPTGGPR